MGKPTLKFCMCLCLVMNCIVLIAVLCVAVLTHQGCSDGEFQKGAVAADSEMCSKIGRDTLREGGSAVDGAIATLVCTSIVHPQSMGIGGGSIFTIREKDGTVKIINARETVPKVFKSDLLTKCPPSYQLMSGTVRKTGPCSQEDHEALAATQEQFAKRIRGMIKDGQTHDALYYSVTPSMDSVGTTHMSLVDEYGMAVSVTSTINHIFGSKIFSPKTGIILNNELADFCGKVSSIQAGEQPPSSMSPSILYSTSRKHLVVAGGSGGSMITTGMALTLMNHLWMGMSLQDAIASPVVFVNSKNEVNFEPKFDKDVQANLTALGHSATDIKYFYNVINAVSVKDGCITAVSDERKLGKAAGY
ncbi:gamma-glutamyltransferase 5a [Engraulis encrasicolus]|uniref:gamma-glutamyltransferase 5a n=1 Tax=Engraulis encrasicolus TaxID=184585 RepID=UPI002FD25B93